MSFLEQIYMALPPREIVLVITVAVLMVVIEIPAWHRMEVDVACGAASEWWDVLQGVRVLLDVVEAIAVASVLAMGIWQTPHRFTNAIIVCMGLKTILTIVLVPWAVGHTPRDSDLNARYCDWRTVTACWKTPNTTLDTYELLFSVTQATLFRREFAQPFRPLETRYEISVLWNAMDRCQNLSTHGQTQATVFDSLAASVQVDAWCGAMQSSRRDQGELLVSYDAVIPPAEAFKDAVETRCEAIRLGVLVRVMLVRLLIHSLLTVLALAKWRAQQKQSPPRPMASSGMENSDSDGNDEPDDGSNPLQAETSPLVVEPSWVQVNAQVS